MEKLKWLFTAEYNDGSCYNQNPEDKSIITEGKNCFYDVLQNIDKVIRFGFTDGVTTYTVDLRDAHFEIDGNLFRVEHEPNLPLKNIRLIYFRRVQKDLHVDVRVNDELKVEATGNRIGETRVWYRLGWQANLPDGSNVQRVIEFT